MENLYLDIHALQILPPSCVNRDDTGAPKTCVYGGTVRSRVSSQAWKKAIRDEFKDIFSEDDLGTRTKRVVKLIQDEIIKQAPDLPEEKAEEMAVKALENAGIKVKAVSKTNAEKVADALTFIGSKQVSALAELAIAGEKDKAAYKRAFNEFPSIDVALFGRMVAADPTLNCDAACQVAHAISTHGVDVETDYFTAVDDEAKEDNAGAGHVGTSEYNSCTLYRYATINLKALEKMLGEKTPEAAEGFLRAFITSMPTGKQNSYANRTLPSDVYISLRNDQPVSLAGAFEAPVKPSDDGFEVRSARKLQEYAEKMYSTFAHKPVFAVTIGENLTELGQNDSLDDALEAIKAEITTRLHSEES